MVDQVTATANARVVVHDLRRLPLPAATVGCDVAAAAYVLHEFDDEHKLRLLDAVLDGLKPAGVVVVADVAFENEALRAAARSALGVRWDPDEHYFAAEQFADEAARRGLQVGHEQLGAHAGVLLVGRGEAFVS